MQGPAITPLARRWVKSTGAAEPPGPPARQPQALTSKSSREGPAPSTRAAPGGPAQGGTLGRLDPYEDFGTQTAGLQRPATSSSKQIIHKKQQLGSLSAGDEVEPKWYEPFSTFSQTSSI